MVAPLQWRWRTAAYQATVLVTTPFPDMTGADIPGAVYDLTAARIWGIVRDLAGSGLVALGDNGYLRKDCIRTPYRG